MLSCGYLANLAAVTPSRSTGDLVVSEAHNHASLIDACRLSRARTAVAAHARPERRRPLLAARRAQAAPLVVTDSVFSVDGDLAPLADSRGCRAPARAPCCSSTRRTRSASSATAARAACAALGVAGDRRRAHRDAVEGARLAGRRACSGPRAVIDHVIDSARPFIFDTGLAPAAVGAGARRRCARSQDDPGLAARARATRARPRRGGARRRLRPASEPDAAVTAIAVGAPDLAVAAAAACLARGVRVGCFRPPSVPDGISRLRLTARADLTDADLAAALRDVLVRPCGREVRRA